MVLDPDDAEGATRFLSGEHVTLRPLEKADLVHILKWANDPEIRRLTGEVRPMSRARGDEFLEKVKTSEDRAWFIILLKESGRVIGEIGLLRMFHAWRTTDMSIIIGEKEEWGKGYGTEAVNLLLDYAFGYLNFHRVAIGVVGFHDAALRFYDALGFNKEGIQREGYYHDHAYHDFVMMSILEDEFRARRKAASG